MSLLSLVAKLRQFSGQENVQEIIDKILRLETFGTCYTNIRTLRLDLQIIFLDESNKNIISNEGVTLQSVISEALETHPITSADLLPPYLRSDRALSTAIKKERTEATMALINAGKKVNNDNLRRFLEEQTLFDIRRLRTNADSELFGRALWDAIDLPNPALAIVLIKANASLMIYTVFERISEKLFSYYHLTIVHQIIRKGNISALKAILETHGGDVYNKIKLNKESISCLSLALELNATEAVQLLLEHKAPFKSDEENSLFETAKRKQWDAIYVFFNVSQKDESIITKEKFRQIAHKLWDIAIRQENGDALTFIKRFTNKFHYYHYHFEREESSQRRALEYDASRNFRDIEQIVFDIKRQMAITQHLNDQILTLQQVIEELKEDTTEIDCHITEEAFARTSLENREIAEAQYLFSTWARVSDQLKKQGKTSSELASKIPRLQKTIKESQLDGPFSGAVALNRPKNITILEKIVELMLEQLETGNATSRERMQELQTLISQSKICVLRGTNKKIDVLISNARTLLAARSCLMTNLSISSLFKKIETINATELPIRKERIISSSRFFTQSGDDIFTPEDTSTYSLY